MVIYEVKELVDQAKKHYLLLKKLLPDDTEELKLLSDILFSENTPENINRLQEWLDDKENEDLLSM